MHDNINKPRLFIDLDDVIVDLWRFIREYHNMPHDAAKIDKHWLTVKDIPRLFKKLKPIPGSFEFVNTISEQYRDTHYIGFLTSIPKPIGPMITADQDKREWVKRFISDHVPVHTIIGGEHKCQYVNGPTDILIDDLYRNIEAWNNKGGIGVHHTSFENSLQKLSEIIVDTT